MIFFLPPYSHFENLHLSKQRQIPQKTKSQMNLTDCILFPLEFSIDVAIILLHYPAESKPHWTCNYNWMCITFKWIVFWRILTLIIMLLQYIRISFHSHFQYINRKAHFKLLFYSKYGILNICLLVCFHLSLKRQRLCQK